MPRIALAVSLAVVLAGVAAAENTLFFSADKAPKVNLLERWNLDGTYGLQVDGKQTYYANNVATGVVYSVSYMPPGANFPTAKLNGYSLLNTVSYDSSGSSSFAHSSVVGEDRVVEITYTFATPVVIDTVSCGFDTATRYAPNNYEWLVNGVSVFSKTNTTTRLPGVHTDKLSQAVTVTTLTFRMTLDGGPISDANYQNVRLGNLGAYLSDSTQAAAGQYRIDGTYNIFYQETAPGVSKLNTVAGIGTGSTVTINNGYWTGHNFGLAQQKLPTTDQYGACTEWMFEQEYEMTGFLFSMGTTVGLPDAMIEVFDGTEWVWAWGGKGNLYRWSDNKDYILFENPVVGSGVRMSWGAISGSQPEARQFQLFGAAVPEPATMTLLALGGAALLRRKR